MRKFVLTVTTILIAGVFSFGLISPSTALAKPVKFKAVAFLPVNNANVAGFKIFIKKINEKFKDSIHIDLLGGPEVIPPFQLHEAVRKGVIDMCLTSCGYYPSLVWLGQSAMFSNKTYDEIAKTDYYTIMENLHKKVGLVWLGQGTLQMYFYLFVNPKIRTLKDLSGKKIRIFPPLIPFMKRLGAIPINLPMGDIYTAMERGAVDGFVMTDIGFVKDFHWNEVTKQVIAYPIYQAVAVILANQKKWNKLPPEVQKAIIAFKRNTIDPAISEYYKNLSSKSWDALIKSGVKPVKFSQSGGKTYLKDAYDAAWENISKKAPVMGPKLKAMLVK